MANFNKGILGGFTGKVGTIVGSQWKGISYMRSLPASGNRQPSAAQLTQAAKFSMAIKFVQSMGGLVKMTFHNFANKMTEFNNAMSYTLKHAINGSFPNFGISYADVLVSRGDLPNGLAPAAIAASNSMIDFKWTNNGGTGMATDADKVILVAYEPGTNSTVYTTATAQRSDLAGSLNLLSFRGKKVHTYISFISANGKEFSNSIYTGEVVVS